MISLNRWCMSRSRSDLELSTWLNSNLFLMTNMNTSKVSIKPIFTTQWVTKVNNEWFCLLLRLGINLYFELTKIIIFNESTCCTYSYLNEFKICTMSIWTWAMLRIFICICALLKARHYRTFNHYKCCKGTYDSKEE